MGLILIRMIGYRSAAALPLMLAVSVLIFLVLRLIPADPIGLSLPPNATAEDRAELARLFGLDLPIWQQYLRWLARVATGEFGTSIHFRRDVADLILTTLPATLELVLVGILIGTLAGVGGGLWLFAERNRPWAEGVLDTGASALMAVPEFLWAILLILSLGVAWRLLPFLGRIDPALSVPVVTGFILADAMIAGRVDALVSALAHLTLPALALGLSLAPLIARVLRASLLDTVAEDYIQRARLSGLSERQVLIRHALPNAVLPTISLIGVQSGFMFGGTLLVEVIFAYPGLGNLMVDAVRATDLPVIQAAALAYCAVVLALNLIVDIVTIALNPKLRPAP